MCGNFGLLMLGKGLASQSAQSAGSVPPADMSIPASRPPTPDVDSQMLEVSRHGGIRLARTDSYSMNGRRATSIVIGKSADESFDSSNILPPIKILEAQTACTEIRGGQAGGYSCIEHRNVVQPSCTRVRLVARKRHPLAADLAELFIKKGGNPDKQSIVTVIGHTRFATSSINQVPELHPHEWTPFHHEHVWQFNRTTGEFEQCNQMVGIHLTHNGDFDELEAYNAKMVVEEVGLWLERILHVPNSTNGDSPKLVGCMDLLRVQGRWAAAARLAWVRCVISASTDVSGGEPLSKSAPNTFPPPQYWHDWAAALEPIWQMHYRKVISVIAPEANDKRKTHRYFIDRNAEEDFVRQCVKDIYGDDIGAVLNINTWNAKFASSFFHYLVRGFLRGDLYNALTELLSRAEGSFGLQVHCTLEPGVCVIASKGQPMSISFHPFKPICLFASEAEALAVPIDANGDWLPERIDLDSHGEIVRIGEPRSLLEGVFLGHHADYTASVEHLRELLCDQDIVRRFGAIRIPQNIAANGVIPQSHQERLFASSLYSLEMRCGVEIRSYSLVSCGERSVANLLSRAVQILAAPVPYDPRVDLVANDLAVTPAVLNTIDRVWKKDISPESLAARSLAAHLVNCMKRRIAFNSDTTDLLIGGVEISLWVAEQWAADLRSYFPQLNISTVSANKLLGLGSLSAGKVFFPGSDSVLPRRIDESTCVLLISQSGQTFPTLHATRKLATMVPKRLWIMTGCFNSKMEQALVEGYKSKGMRYERNRVFNNYSGNRPAEPSTVAVAATWHTLTQLLLRIVTITKDLCPHGCLLPHWQYEHSAKVLQKWARHMKLGKYNIRRKRVKVTEEMQDEWKGNRSPSKSSQSKFPPPTSLPNSSTTMLLTPAKGSSSRSNQVVLVLTDGCIKDINNLMTCSIVPNMCDIVGYDVDGNKFASDCNKQLVHRGLAWADHINEPWSCLVLAGAYIILSVGLSLPIFGLIADAFIAVIWAGTDGHGIMKGHLGFSPRTPHVLNNQSLVWTLVGLAIQFADAVFFVFLVKIITWAWRWVTGRPMWARHGKRTIVIVDNPCVHQLTENFVSKLYSQGYSFCTPEVHGASGLDHFVHRFTHRVVRGVLLAVGRPDGRMCCLAKSESAILLAAKQAAFIRNPDYPGESSGPEFVTIGHNPFKPNMGLAHHIVLGQNSNIGRKKFLDEFLFERLSQAAKPFSSAILRSLSRQVAVTEYKRAQILKNDKDAPRNVNAMSRELAALKSKLLEFLEQESSMVPYGVHHIDPDTRKNNSISPLFSEFVMVAMAQLNQLKRSPSTDPAPTPVVSNDPAVRLAFASRVDSTTQTIQDSQKLVQQFYECRIASLERYIAFCVMFHAMADKSRHPWLHPGWDVARSQSNLRVATTASPISASDAHAGPELSKDVKKICRDFASLIRGVVVHF